MKIKSMRSVPTIQGLAHRSVPSNRALAASELARMEHEKERLQGELTLWTAKQLETELRLEKANDRINALRQTLLGSSDGHPSSEDTGRASTADDKKVKGWREMSLEY